MNQVPQDLQKQLNHESIRNIHIASPWIIGFASLSFLLFSLFQVKDLPKINVLVFQIVFLVTALSFGVAWWVTKNSQVDGRWNSIIIHFAYWLTTIETAVVVVIENIDKINLASLAVYFLVAPALVEIRPIRYRVISTILLVAIMIPLYHYIDDLTRFGYFFGQAISIAIPSMLLQNSLFKRKLQIYHQMMNLVESNQKLAHTATRDHLTGLPNRRSFEERLELEWARKDRHKQNFSLLSFDVDFFKKINDTKGHPFGDRVLKELGVLLQKITRECDLAARVGGEEFMVILVETDVSGANAFAERLLQAAPGITASQAYGKPITISIGLAQSDEEESPEAFLHLVDQRLYQAKSNGRNCIVNKS